MVSGGRPGSASTPPHGLHESGVSELFSKGFIIFGWCRVSRPGSVSTPHTGYTNLMSANCVGRFYSIRVVSGGIGWCQVAGQGL